MTETKTKTIVVGMDLEEEGDLALVQAIRMAAQTGAALHVVHVIPVRRDTEVLADALELGMARLRERVGPLVMSAPAEIRLHVGLGDPAMELHQVAVDVDADLLVVGTHARRGVARMVLGSVAEKLVRTARLPVVVAREKSFDDLERRREPDAPIPGAVLGGPRRISEAIRVAPRSAHIAGLV